MEELVNLVVKKTGLPKETAQTVVKIVLDFLKKKLPPVAAAAIDGFLNNKGQTAAAANMLGGFLGAAKKTAKKK
jgi:nucleoid DNA-binding protein